MRNRSALVVQLNMRNVLLLFVAGAFHGFASLSQDLFKNWDILQESSGGLGYDSNIYGGRASNVEDGFAEFSHSVRLARARSLTNLELNGEVSGTRYFTEGEADFLDGGLEVLAGYPTDADRVSFWNGSAHWRRNTELNLDTGLRLQPTVYGVNLNGEWLASPKFGLTGSVQSAVNDRSRDGLNTTRKLRFRTGLSHEWRPEQRLNAEYAYTLGHSNGGVGTDSKTHEVGIRTRGRLLPKVTGYAFVGLQKAEFSGRQDFSDSAPVFAADLKWQASPMFTATVGLDRDYDFRSDGLAKLQTLVTVSLDRSLGSGYSVSGSVSRGLTTYEHGVSDREDRFWLLGAEVEYAFTERFFVQLSASYVTNESGIDHNIHRGVVLLRSGFRY